MSREIPSRLEKLEAVAPTANGARPWRRIITHSHKKAGQSTPL